MSTVDIHEVEAQLFKLVETVEKGEVDAVIIARDRVPVARLTSLKPQIQTARRIGIAKGRFDAPEDPYAADAQVAALFLPVMS